MTLNVRTLNIVIFSISTLGIMKHRITTLCLTTICIMALVTFAECIFYVKCRKQVRYAEWHYRKCRYSDCRGATRWGSVWATQHLDESQQAECQKTKGLKLPVFIIRNSIYKPERRWQHLYRLKASSFLFILQP